MKKPTKKELLKHYARREPKPFIQFDDFIGGPFDDVLTDDGEGHCIFGGMETYELMQGAPVRILIEPDIPYKKVMRSLQKIRTYIQRDKCFYKKI